MYFYPNLIRKSEYSYINLNIKFKYFIYFTLIIGLHSIQLTQNSIAYYRLSLNQLEVMHEIGIGISGVK